MTRYRMLPTKSNFPGRWSGSSCNVCGFDDTDVHVFTCPGYADLNPTGISFEIFWDIASLENMEILTPGAKMMNKIIARMEEIQNM